ncbi:MarR family transcriptional regulator [Paenibacillus glycanilyticus]|uniref:MarR family winged helix-turn-helix transcriptional regulator n=1 Tax=Paenibacillus glycanilyticus TaxID=126569 RepID=UPI00203BE7E3|nr:MarR family transcriptional regulator [Paenibacillus glycanilyticus]MCM3629672.1 MarR family transcriptional regulator [Paenibacillus glycanilyticus]
MDSKDKLFLQMVSHIAAIHQLHYDMTKGLPMEDITPQQYEILEFLSVKQPITLSEISECMGISMPNTSREIRKLAEKDLCEKIEDPEDRRKQYIRLAPAGEERMANAFGHMRQLFLQQLEHAPEEELARISEALDVLGATIFRTESKR